MYKKQTIEWLRENWFRAGILIVLLIITYSFYHVLVVQPSVKKQEEEKKIAEIKKNLDGCLANSSQNYSQRWHKECKSLGRLSDKCIDINELTFEEYLKKYEITEEEYKKERSIPEEGKFAALFDYIDRKSDECSCRLPISTADRFEKTLKEDRSDCYRQYPL